MCLTLFTTLSVHHGQQPQDFPGDLVGDCLRSRNDHAKLIGGHVVDQLNGGPISQSAGNTGAQAAIGQKVDGMLPLSHLLAL